MKMPELPPRTVVAIGFGYRDGLGAWSRIGLGEKPTTAERGSDDGGTAQASKLPEPTKA